MRAGACVELCAPEEENVAHSVLLLTFAQFGRLPDAYSPNSSSASASLVDAQFLDRNRPVWSASRLSVTSASHMSNGSHRNRWQPRSSTPYQTPVHPSRSNCRHACSREVPC